MTERIPVCWEGERIIVVHAGGTATGILEQVRDVASAVNPHPHLVLRLDDGRRAAVYWPGILYIAPAKVVPVERERVSLVHWGRHS